MSLDTSHPELEAEQAYVDRAYACMEFMRDEVEALTPRGRNDYEKEVFERWQQARIAALSDTTSALVFGRIDEQAGDTFYIGRHHVRDREYETVVVDWRAPVARTFYQAGVRDPMGLRRRRQFLVEGREVLGITDDDFAQADGELRATEILEHELARRRTGRMRDVVATIQAEQDAIIRSPLEGIVVVQGGPGTGKTVVGLHRAAFLLYEHRQRLQRLGVLVVGPNPVFVRYISQVLPSLGEAAVTQVPVTGLAPGPRPAVTDDPSAERLKGDARMAEVVRRALDDRRGEAKESLELSYRGVSFAVDADVIAAEVDKLRRRGAPWRRGREQLREHLVTEAYRSYERALNSGGLPELYDEVSAAIRRDPAFRRTVDAVWPAISAERLVGDLWASPAKLRSASEGVLDSGSRRLLRRSREKGRMRFSHADGPLLDEAHALIEGTPERYGHVVADEAQDLSPMQLRMLARRCPQGSMTVLGDLGQATGVWAHDDWSEVVDHLPEAAGRRMEELTLGYRVGPAVMEVASAILAEAAPALRPPRAVRRERGEVRFSSAPDESLGAVTADEARRVVEETGTAAIIVPRALVGAMRVALKAAGLSFGDAQFEGLDEPLTLVDAVRAKGLEFDGVVLVEPAAIADEGGLRLLYVAVTRGMRTLSVVHAMPLPACMQRAGVAASTA